jgi:hypothetical protein
MREFTKLLVFATHLICDKESRLIKFCEGLHPKICLAVSMAKPNSYQKALDLSLNIERNIQLVEEIEIRNKGYRDTSIEEDGEGENQEEKEEKVNKELKVCNICHRFHRGEC